MQVNSSDLESIFNKVAERHNTTSEVVEAVYKHEFQYLRQLISNLDYPIFLMHGIGTFRVKQTPLENYIRSYIKSYRQGKSSYERTKKAIAELWKLRRQLQTIQASNKKKPKNTTKKYSNYQKTDQQK